MTIGNVREAVVGFGYDYGLDDAEGAFKASLPIAIREINALRPRTATAVIVHEPYDPVFEDTAIHTYNPGEQLTFSCMARSAIFEVDGAGAVAVENATLNGDASWNASTGWKRYTALWTPPATGEERKPMKITFSGDSTYHVRNVAFFDVVGTIGLKYGEYIDYDLSSITSNYEGVKYILRDNVDYTDYQIVNGKQLRLRASDTGTYEIIYRTKITVGTTDTSTVPLDDDLAALLPLLVASYAWLDDNASRSQYYRALYERQAALIEKERVNIRMIDTRGWS
jgi:hypothetical protein